MFNIGNILERSWKILWRYRLLWVFALLLAISGGAGNGGGGGGSGYRFSGAENRPNPQNWQWPWSNQQVAPWLNDVNAWLQANIYPLFSTPERAIQTAVIATAVIIGVVLVISLLLALVRYPSETAVIRLADQYDRDGTKLRFKQAWQLGWNRRAWKVFLVDLLIGAPATTIILVLLAIMGWLIYLLASTGAVQVSPGAVVGIILIVLLLIAFALFMALVSLLRQYVVRFAALEGMGVKDSFKHGWQMFKTSLGRTIVLGLVLIGVGLAFGFAMILAFFLLIPAYIILAFPGALAALIPGGLAYLVAIQSAPPLVAAIIAAIVGMPLFFAVTFLPLSFLGGMFAVFNANAWTLAFRQLHPVATAPVSGSEMPPALNYDQPPA